MNTRLKISLLTLVLFSAVAMLSAASLSVIPILDVYPSIMEDEATAACTFTEEMNYQLYLVDRDNFVVDVIAEGVSEIGTMYIPIDRLDRKGDYIPSGKYWLTLSYDAKFTSTKKLLILK